MCKIPPVLAIILGFICALSLTSCGIENSGQESPILTEIVITPASVNIASGYIRQYHAIGNLSDNTQINLTGFVTWHSSNEQVFQIFAGGEATSVGQGTAEVSATLDLEIMGRENLAGVELGLFKTRSTLQSNISSVVVTSATLEGIQILASVDSIPKGFNLKFNAVGLFSDGSTQDLTQQVQWFSSDPNIAEIIGKGAVNFLREGDVVISTKMNNINSNEYRIKVTGATVVEIQISTEKDQIAKGYTQNYQAVATLSDQSTIDVTDQVNWNSSDETKATISTNGNAYFLNEGEVTIKATRDGVVSNPSFIKINAPEIVEIEVNSNLHELPVGYSLKPYANGVFSDKSRQEVTESVNWHSSDINVAVVDSDGYVQFLSLGNVKIYATKRDVISNNVAFNVVDAVLTEIQVLIPSSNIAKGYTQQLQAIATYNDKSTFDVTNQVAWISDDFNIATISQQGLAHFIEEGDVTLQAKLLGVQSNLAQVKVTAAQMTKLEIVVPMIEIPKGYKQQYQAIGTFSDQSNRDVTSQVSWHSSNLELATITTDGYADFKEEGEVEITATNNDIKSNKSNIKITEAELIELTISAAFDEVPKGYNQQYKVIGLFSDRHAEELTDQVNWITENIDIVSITDMGMAYMVAEGNSKITARIDSCVSNSLDIKVTPAILKSIEIEAPSHEIAVGYMQRYTAQGIFSDDHVEDLTKQVNWHSSDLAIATISTNGQANFMKVGQVEITASLNQVDSNIATVDVLKAVITDMFISQKFYNMALGANAMFVGSQVQYRVLGFFSDGTSLDISSQVNWNLEDTSIATVDLNGVVRGQAVGETYLEVSHSNFDGLLKIKVKILPI